MSQDFYTASPDMIPPLPADAPIAMPAMPQNFQQGAPRPSDGVPKFFIKAVRYADGSYHNVEYVDIITPGDPKSLPRHKVTDAIRQLYPHQYEAFRRGLEMAPEGWPLEMWSVLNPAQVYHLKSLNIFTVEQLAQIADANLHQIPMGRTLKNQAIVALKAKGETDSVEAMRRKDELNKQAISSLEESNALLMKQLAELSAKVEAQTTPRDEPPRPTTTLDGDTVPAPAKRGPGRPRNADVA